MKGDDIGKACYHLAQINESLTSGDFDPTHIDFEDVNDAFNYYECADEFEFKGSGVTVNWACYYANDEFEDKNDCQFGEDCWPTGCQKVPEPNKGQSFLQFASYLLELWSFFQVDGKGRRRKRSASFNKGHKARPHSRPRRQSGPDGPDGPDSRDDSEDEYAELLNVVSDVQSQAKFNKLYMSVQAESRLQIGHM